MFRNHVPPNFEGVRRRNSVWGLHRYAGTAGTRRESRAPEHSLLPAYARGARRNMSDFVLSDFEDEDAAGGCFDSDDEVEERVAARESMDEDSDDEDSDDEGPRARDDDDDDDGIMVSSCTTFLVVHPYLKEQQSW